MWKCGSSRVLAYCTGTHINSRVPNFSCDFFAKKDVTLPCSILHPSPTHCPILLLSCSVVKPSEMPLHLQQAFDNATPSYFPRIRIQTSEARGGARGLRRRERRRKENTVARAAVQSPLGAALSPFSPMKLSCSFNFCI